MEKIIIDGKRHYPLKFKHAVIKEYLADGIGILKPVNFFQDDTEGYVGF